MPGLKETSNGFTVTVDKSDVRKIDKALKGIKHNTPQMINSAINKTANYARGQIARGVNKKYAIKQTNSKKDLDLHKSTKSTLVATITSKGRPLDLYKFSHSTPEGNAVKAKQLKERSLKALTVMGDNGKPLKAFIITFANGHSAIAQRKGPSRFPIKIFYGSSVPVMIGGTHGVYREVAPLVEAKLKMEMENEIEKKIMKAQVTK